MGRNCAWAHGREHCAIIQLLSEPAPADTVGRWPQTENAQQLQISARRSYASCCPQLLQNLAAPARATPQPGQKIAALSLGASTPTTAGATMTGLTMTGAWSVQVTSM